MLAWMPWILTSGKEVMAGKKASYNVYHFIGCGWLYFNELHVSNNVL